MKQDLARVDRLGEPPLMPNPEVLDRPQCPSCRKAAGVPLVAGTTADFCCPRCKHIWVVLRQQAPRPPAEAGASAQPPSRRTGRHRDNDR